MLMPIYGIQKGSADEPVCRAAVEPQTQRPDLWTQQGRKSVGLMERAAWKHYITLWKIDSQWEFAL